MLLVIATITNKPQMAKLAASAYMPMVVLCVASLMAPTMNGLTKPAKLPIALSMAMPATAAVPDKKLVGSVQNKGNVDKIPAAAIDKTTIATTVFLPLSALKIWPSQPSAAANAVCQRRSPDASELRAMSKIVTAATL